MYWGMPAVTARDRLARWPALDPSKVLLSPLEAAERIGLDPLPPPAQVRLNSFDGRPVYRFGAGGPDGDGGRIVYADTGEEQAGAASILMRQRAVTAWTGRPARDAVVESVTEPDQWTVGNRLRTLRPLWRYSWPNGEDVYIGESGEVLLHTTRLSRFQAYISAVPHWLYFTPLRANQPFWIRFATYTAMVGTVGAIIGVVLGVWLYSPSKKKYRHAGVPSSIPYKGQKRWHTILGLIFGVATVTWTLSGSLAFFPFPASARAGAGAARTGAGAGAGTSPRAGTAGDGAGAARAPRRRRRVGRRSTGTGRARGLRAAPPAGSARHADRSGREGARADLVRRAAALCGEPRQRRGRDPPLHRSEDGHAPRHLQASQLGAPLLLQRSPLAQLPVVVQPPSAVGHRGDRVHGGWDGAMRDGAHARVAGGWQEAAAARPASQERREPFEA